jgi:hypothetical protein
VKPLVCRHCRTDRDVAIYGLCPACLHRVNARECAEQGIPEKIENPAFYDTVAKILLTHEPIAALAAPAAQGPALFPTTGTANGASRTDGFGEVPDDHLAPLATAGTA